MQQNCPDCNTELVSSAVGLLCPGCGSLHQFEKMSSTGTAVAVHTPSQPTLTVHDMVKPTVPKPTKVSKPKKLTHTKPESAKPTKYSLKRHMKRLMVPELPPPHVSDYSHDSHIADTELAPAGTAAAAPHQVTDISRKYNETFVPDETATATATVATTAAVASKHQPEHTDAEPQESWKESVDDSPSSFVVSRSLIMIVAAILLLVAAYLAVFWFKVV